MNALFLGVDFLWSARIHRLLDFEYGAGIAGGFTFGDLEQNWVKADPNGSLKDSKGNHSSACAVGDTAKGCNAADHSDTKANPNSPLRVGGFNEPAWTSGGKKPSALPSLSLPELGLRFRPMKELESRVSLGVSPYGFYFQLSANYALPFGGGAKSK